MHRLLTTLVGLLCSVLAAAAFAAGVEFHVATTGQDTNPGSLQKPFRTLEAARNAVRNLSHGSAPAAPVTVILHNGSYRLARPFTLGPEDSGTQAAPVTYRAAEAGKAIVSGGRAIRGWKPGQGSLWQVEIPEVRQGHWYFHALFVDGHRRTRARTPNEGFLQMEGPAIPYKHDLNAIKDAAGIHNMFKFKPGDMDSKWRNPEDINVFLYHSWTNSLHWLDSIDASEQIARLKNPSGYPIGWWEKNQRYYVENVREALDSPGEWYLDRKTGLLEYWPLPGEDLTKVDVVAPVLDQLVAIEGNWQTGKLVHDVAFVGLSFQHTDWAFRSKTEKVDGQSCSTLPAAIRANGAKRIALDRCEVAHVGEYAIFLEAGCQHDRIVHCEVHDMGAGGIRVGETGGPLTPQKNTTVKKPMVFARTMDGAGPRDTGHNLIDNNFIHDGGHVFAAGTGVFLGHTGFNQITHNEISDLNYSGVCVGWVWGFGPSVAHHNRIADNHIHHLGWGVLSDMGGVYTLGPSPGTVVAHNLVHHVCSYSYGGWGLYTDEGSSDIILENNIVYDTKSGGFHQHYGSNNLIRNNIFAFSRETQIRRSREDKKSSLIFQHNLVYCDNDQILTQVWRNGDYKVDCNVYWTTAKATPLFDRRDFAEWRATSGQDRHSLLADPRFVDPAHRDFRLRPNSPAMKIGFHSIDLAGIGLYGEARWVAAPKKVVRPEFVLPETAKPTPDSVNDDFERTPVGERPRDATVVGENGEAAVRVTDKAAAGGKRSLKVTCDVGLSQKSNPYMFYTLNCRQGPYRGSFDVRRGPDSAWRYEWRDAAMPYRVGPAIQIEANGDVKCGKRKLAMLPVGQWAHVEVRCGLGSDAHGTFDAIITTPGSPPQRFEKLPCDSKDFSRLEWLGFISGSRKSAMLYLDNLRVEPVR